MLFEYDVINAVCTKLEALGYSIRQKLKPVERGDDIIAVKGGPIPCELHIEAKGSTSSRKNSRRYGKPFDSAQIRVHVAEALYKSAGVLANSFGNQGIRAGIALPDNEEHRVRIRNVEPILKQLGIAVFWVRENGAVEIVSDWIF